MKWGEKYIDYTMNGVSFKVMQFIYALSRMNNVRNLNPKIDYCFTSKTAFRERFDITEPTYRKVMADLTERGYIRYKENRNHFVEVEVLV